jgi:tetratricopeptide (TPR) repeat protein
MKSSTTSHLWTAPTSQAEPHAQTGPYTQAGQHAQSAGDLPIAPASQLEVHCHRRLCGPYTGAGTVLRRVVPELLAVDRAAVAARAAEIVTMAPELIPVLPVPPQTLTNLVNRAESTRFYPLTRTLRLSHGAAELLMDWARLLHPGGVVITFLDLDDADPCDREFVSVLLRRCDPELLTVVVEASSADDALGQVLTRFVRQAARPPRAGQDPRAGADLAQLFIDSDGTDKDPAVGRAYAALPADERASRHSARAQVLAALGQPSLRRGAIPYHQEHGIDPSGAGAEALAAACYDCFDVGCYEAAFDLALRGRELTAGADNQERYEGFTLKAGACLSNLKRGSSAFAYFDELRRITVNPDAHMNSCFELAMLYARHLPPADQDASRALEWANTAIAIADCHPDPHKRVFYGAFMRNARALAELLRGDAQTTLALVNEAIAMTDADPGSDEHLVHRSVLRYNRAQMLNALGDYVGSLHDYDAVLSRDPEYGDYYFQRAGVRRTAGRYDEALADYATAIRLSPPFHEAHYNRADLLRELGDADGALRDLDYAVVLDPDNVDTRVNRADLLLERGETQRARADIDAGLELDPGNANLLTARGSLLEESGDADAAYASYTAALTQDPAFAAAWANRAVLCYSAGRAADAVADLDQAIVLADDPWLRLNRAIALHDLDEDQRAVADLDIAVAALGAEEVRLRAGDLLPGDLVPGSTS